MSPARRFFVSLAILLAPLSASYGGDLGGSPTSMEEQHAVAVEADYSFLRKPADVERLVELGRLVEVKGNRDFSLSAVSFPYARPEVLTFIESLAADYRDEFGFQLVVTSLTRPKTLQPSNAHKLSVHPAGMAVDLRVPSDSTRKAWLEERLLRLEDAGAVEVTREKRPPHYHVAVFAEKYLPIAEQEKSERAERRARAEVARLAAAAAAAQEKGPADPPAHLVLFAGLTALVGAPVVAYKRRKRAVLR